MTLSPFLSSRLWDQRYLLLLYTAWPLFSLPLPFRRVSPLFFLSLYFVSYITCPRFSYALNDDDVAQVVVQSFHLRCLNLRGTELECEYPLLHFS